MFNRQLETFGNIGKIRASGSSDLIFFLLEKKFLIEINDISLIGLFNSFLRNLQTSIT